MSSAGSGGRGPWSRLRAHWDEPQHRNGYYLLFNNALGAAVGVVFWILLSRLLGIPSHEIGIGYAVIALGTILAVLAKGGLDTALLRSVPGTSPRSSRRLLRFAIGLGVGVSLLLALVLAYLAQWLRTFDEIGATGWLLASLIAALLVATWLQDAYFLAAGDSRHSFHRNLAFSAARLTLPFLVVLLALPQAVALSWALALLASALVAFLLLPRAAPGPGAEADRPAFLQSAVRNISGSAAEFLPGLLLAPLVLSIHGPVAAAHFGMAWTAASLLFLACAALSRSALAEIVRRGPAHEPAVLRRAFRHHLLVLAPGIVAALLLAPWVLGLFGPEYARDGAPVFQVLALSTLAVAPTYLFLSHLRAHERSLPLALFPAALVVALAVLAPILGGYYGPVGVAHAWLLANLPFGLYATWRLSRLAQQEVTHASPATRLGGPAHLE